MSESRDVMNTLQAAEHLGVDVKTLRKWRETEALPFSKVGSRVFYRRAKLDEWLDTRDGTRPVPPAGPSVVRRPRIVL